MKYYILDDDINIVKILQNIVERDFNRTVIGYNVDPIQATDEIIACKPNAVLIDYLMPSMDGVDVIKKVKSILPQIEFIMISQVVEKQMIGEAYEKGVSFFISKPINKIEVNVVLKNLEDRLGTSKKLEQILNLIRDHPVSAKDNISRIEVIKGVLRDLGINSEKGSKDILSVIEIMEMEGYNHWSDAFKVYSRKTGERGKSIRQRMRRAITKALRNLAYLGLEDYMNENFVKYSSSLFDFETVKLEMDFIRGVNVTRGTIFMNKFLENLEQF